MKTTSLLASLALAATTSFSFAAGQNWETDFAAAQKKASAEKKDLLVDFTGSDWCHWCIKLDEEVFQKDAFKKGVADKFILVELDYPQDKSKQSEALQKQNAELQEKYSIQGFPTILLLDSKGRPFAQTGYQEGGPEKYLTHLDELLKIRTGRDEKISAAEKLEGVAKAKALYEAVSFLPTDLLKHYPDLATQIKTLDPKDESGFQAEQQKAALFQKMEQSYVGAMQTGKIDEAIKLVDEFIATTKPQGEALQEIISMKMDPLLGSQNFDEAEKVLEAIIAAGPKTQIGEFAEKFKPQLAQMKAEAAAAPPKPAEEKPAEKTEETK